MTQTRFSLSLVAFLVTALLSITIYPNPLMGKSPAIRNFEITSAEGVTLKLPVLDSGPLPAEDDRVRIEMAGIKLRKIEDNYHCLWTFGIRFKTKELPTKIDIKNVTKSPVQHVTQDLNPKATDHFWSTELEPEKISSQNTPWLYDQKPTIRLFKIILIWPDASSTTYHQLSWYPETTKSQILKIIQE